LILPVPDGVGDCGQVMCTDYQKTLKINFKVLLILMNK
jgi:hypothetical protein